MKNISLLTVFIWSFTILLAAWIFGRAVVNRNSADDAISVVGLGTKDFVSDEILWSGSFNAKSMDAIQAYEEILADKEKVRRFFISKGFSDSEFSFGGARIEKTFRTVTTNTEREYETRSESIFDGYLATQTVTFTSKKNPALMQKIEKVSEQTSELIKSGIEFNGNPIQYTYSDLPGLKQNLIEGATADARERAKKIVTTGNGKIGKLKTASMGVFQITGKGSNEEDSYGGNFDIFSKEKTARITVRLAYQLD